jgi:archaellum biogenesis protein FlaJ (TadC family)
LGIKTAKTVKVSRESALSILLLAPSLLFAIYYLLAGKMLEAVLVLPVGMGILLVLRYMARRNLPKKVDFALTTAIFHMYGLSLGETSPEDLVETIAENREYGFYSRIFQKIRSLAKDFGYGITKATAHVAEAVKPPLKDILVRLTNVFSSVEPRGYLEMESSMLIEEYSGYYTRAIETLKTLGGIFTSFQSVTVFLIMTIVIMAIFMIDPSAIAFGYVIAAASVIMMYVLFRASSPRERLVYIGRYPPKFYLGMRWGLIATGASSTLLAVLLYFSRGPPFAFMALGLGVIVPGVFGYMLEKHVNQIDRNYPTFLKALGENLASTSDLKAAFSYIDLMELGPFKKLVKEALARLKLGIGHEQTLETLSSEAASYQVHISNRIFLDALSRGANPLEIGNALGNRVVKFIEFRKSRDVTAKGFQMIIMVMQPLTVMLLIVMQVLAGFMTRYLVNLPYFGFNAIPIQLVEAGNIALIFIMAVVNALTIKEVSGGYWGTFLLNLGILLITSGVTWLAAHIFIEFALGSMPSIELPV